jgi:hypothetical protein
MRTAKPLLAWLLIPCLLVQGSGCTRKHFRTETDKQVDHILHQKDDPLWSLEGWHVYPNPDARFGDNSNPDRPPMPPDDPAARDLSPNPQHPYHKSGVGLVEGTGYLALLDKWDQENRIEEATRDAAERQRRQEQEKEQDGKGKAPDKKSDKPGVLPMPRKDKNGVPDDALPVSFRPAQEKDERYGGPPEKGSTNPLDDALPTTPASIQPQTPEQILNRAEELARRELAEVVTTQGTIPEAQAEARVSQERTFLIKLEQAVELGLINSREYQTRRELVYLAALPVTLERFAFFPQAFAANQTIRERLNMRRPEGFQNRWRIETQTGLTQLFPSGALLLLSFANRTIFNLTNTPDTSVSTLSLDIVQPLLLGAGWAVTLEPLTQAERSLLYAIRDFYKFRQDFFVFIAGGPIDSPTGDVLGGSVSIGAGFVPSPPPLAQPFGAPLARPQVVPDQGARLPAVGPPRPPVQGYLQTLIEKARLVNQYRNIVSLRRYLQLFRVYLEGGIVTSTQVNQVEQQLLRSIEDGLQQQANYRSSVDQFKLQLGLPMKLRLEVADDPLEPMFGQTRRFEEISAQYETLAQRAQGYDAPDEADQLRRRLRALLTGSGLLRGTRTRERLIQQWQDWERVPSRKPGALIDPFDEKLRPLFRELEIIVNRRREIQRLERGDLPQKERRRQEEIEFQIDLGEFERALRNYEARPWVGAKDPIDMQRRLFGATYQRFLALLEEPYRERQVPVRQSWPDLPPLCIDGVDLLSDDDDKVIAAVSRAALENRLDLMNQRAQLVDSWRKIAIAANSLLGTLNVQYHMDTTSPLDQNHPLALGNGWTRRQFIIDTELPLVRIVQRNAYRATLISYQLQRRQMMLAEDQVLFAARSQLRQLRASAYSYQAVQKRQVELAYNQVDQALQAFSQPQQPAGPERVPGLVGPPVQGGGTESPAALTQQLLNAQNSLLQAQNALYNTWVAYLINRMSLYRETGLMRLDPRGVWIDDVATCHCPQHAGPEPGQPSKDERPSQLPPPDELPKPRADELPAPRPIPPTGK